MDSKQLETPMTGKTVQTTRRGISGSTIKMIGVVAMLIDHVAAVVLTRILIEKGLLEISLSTDMGEVMAWLSENMVLYYAVSFMRLIGRLGFPIFCFLLVEGFQKTRDVKKYVLRMGIFALVSEIPFDLACRGRVLEFEYQNVYFTLLLGLLALCAIDWITKHEAAPAIRWVLTVTGIFALPGYVLWVRRDYLTRETWLICGGAVLVILLLLLIGRLKKGLPFMQKCTAVMTITFAAMLLADVLQTDYAGMGVLTIVAMYLFRRRRVFSMLAGCIVLTLMSVSEITAFFALIPIALYNGKRGLKMKYFFYGFYPVHLLLLWLIAAAMGMGWTPAF